MIDHRLISIFLFLLEQEAFITIQDIADYVDVSSRTIRNDLKLIEPWVNQLNLKLIKKTGSGIKIEGLPTDKLRAYNSFKTKNASLYPNGPQERLHFIALKLSSVDCYRIHEFAEDLYVSRSSIHKDLQAVEELLKKHQLTLNRSSAEGLSIEGKEKDIRNMMFSLMTTSSNFTNFITICKNENYECTGDFIFYGLDLTDDEIKHFVLKSGLNASKLTNEFPLINLGQIVVRLLISYIRTLNEKSIKLSDEFKAELANQEFKNEIKNILNNLEKAYNIKFPNDEYFYIQVFYLAFLAPEQQLPYNLNEIKAFTHQLIVQWSNDLGIDLTQDLELKENLIAHLTPVYTRVMHNIPVKNKLSTEIQKMYPNTLKIVSESVQLSDKWSSMQMDDIEFLSLHLAAALEKHKEPLKALLIYSDGLGAVSLLKEKIERAVAEVKIIREKNYNQLNDKAFVDIDLIISTLDITTDSPLPFVVVNTIMSDHDLLLLKKVVMDFYKEKNKPKVRD